MGVWIQAIETTMPNEHNKIFAAMGHIATCSTELELALKAVAGSLIDDYQQFTRITTAELSFSGVIALLLSLYRARYEEDAHFEALQMLTKRADAAQQKRNAVVHSIWRSAGAPRVVTRIKTTAKIKHGYKTQIENWTLDDFEDLVKEFQSLVNELSDLLKELIACEKAFNNPVYPPGA